MQSCDVLIVGGGPAGSSCAWRLRRSGLDVVVMDKATFPRHKVCAGWITPAVITELEIDPVKYRQTRVLQPITGFRTSRFGSHEVDTEYLQPVSYGIRRCEFDHFLVDRCGAQLIQGTTLRALRQENGAWIANEALRASLLIGAGGNFCPVARLLGARVPTADAGREESVVLAQEVEFELSEEQEAECAIDGRIPELFFCDDLQGYGWCFRKGKYLNIGLGREDERQLSARVEAFCQWLQERGRVPRSLPAHFNGHAYRLYGHGTRNVTEERVLLIGDSAGLAYAQSGEGIRPAIESGLLAADAILEADGEYGRDFQARFQSRLTSRFGAPAAHGGISRLLPGVCQRFIGGRLLASRWFTRHVVLDRWFLHRFAAPLA